MIYYNYEIKDWVVLGNRDYIYQFYRDFKDRFQFEYLTLYYSNDKYSGEHKR